MKTIKTMWCNLKTLWYDIIGYDDVIGSYDGNPVDMFIRILKDEYTVDNLCINGILISDWRSYCNEEILNEKHIQNN